MGNQQPKKVGKANKTQIQMACLKAKIHLQMMRDRKNQEVIKGEKQLVAKIKNKSRNKTQQILVAERVVNGLKYAGACNMLMAYANTLRGQAQFLSQNIGNKQKLQPWLPMIYSLLYSSEHLGLSSLNQVKNALRALNDPLIISDQVNQDIKQLLTPSPTPPQMNIYMVQMSQRNNIPLEEINIVGHKFTKDMHPPPSLENSQFSNMERMLAEKLKNDLGGNHGNQGGFGGNQGGFGSNQGGFGSNQGGYGYGNNQGGHGGYSNGFGGQGGFQNPNSGNGFNNNTHQQPQQQPNYLNDNVHNQNINPYKGLSNVKDQGPNFYQPSKINKNNINNIQKPRQFDDFDDIINPKGNQNNNIDPMYPSVDFTKAKHQPYQPGNYGNQNNNHQSQENLNGDSNEKRYENNQLHQEPSPTISQLLRSLGK